MKKISIFLNHSLYSDHNSIYLEKAEKFFFKKLIELNYHPHLFAFFNTGENTALRGHISIDNATALGYVNSNKKIFRKVKLYLFSLINIYLSLKKSDFVYIFFPGNISYLCCILAFFTRKPYGLYVRGIWPNGFLLNRISSSIFKNAKFILTTGPAFKAKVLSYNDYVDEVVPMINVPLKLITPNKSFNKNIFKKVVYVGRLTSSKGIFDVISAIHLLQTRHINIQLSIVGGGLPEEITTIKELIKAKNIDAKVTLHGHISCSDTLAELIASSSILALPTTYPEGFPRVIYEAMLLETAVITTEMPGAIGFLINEENCIITEPKNPDDLAEKIHLLLQNEVLYSSIVKQAKEVVLQKFNGFKSANHGEQFHSFFNKTI